MSEQKIPNLFSESKQPTQRTEFKISEASAHQLQKQLFSQKLENREAIPQSIANSDSNAASTEDIFTYSESKLNTN